MNLKFLSLSFAALLLCASCANDEDVVSEPVTEESAVEDSKEEAEPFVGSALTRGFLKDIQDIDLIDVYDKMTSIIEQIDSLSVEIEDPRCPSLTQYLPLLKNKYSGSEWRLETHHFTYQTIDGQGEPTTLSASIRFVRSTRPQANMPFRRLCFYINPFAPTKFPLYQLPDYLRAFQGDIFITSDYPGTGADSGFGRYTPSTEIKLLAQQNLHCLLAAMELLERLNVRLAKGYHTECYGVSNGGGTAASMLRLVQEGPVEVQQRVRLGCALMLEGSLSNEVILRNMFENNGQSTQLIAPLMAYSLFRTHPDMFPEGTRREDFFTDLVNNQQLPMPDGTSAHYMDCVSLYEDPMDATFGALSTPYLCNQLFTADFYDADGAIRWDHPLVNALLQAARLSDNYEGWQPRSPLVIWHSPTDNVIPYEDVRSQYHLLSNHGRNLLVRMHDWPDMDHNHAAVLSMIYVGLMPDPCPLVHVDRSRW